MKKVIELEEKLQISKSYDLNCRKIVVSGKEIKIYFVTSLVDGLRSMEIVDNLLLLNDEEDEISFEKVINSISALDIGIVENIDEMIEAILSGMILIYIDEYEKFIKVDVRNYPTRSVAEPEMEKVIRGSHDGFTETLNTNIALLRRRVKDERLRTEVYYVGEKSPVMVCFSYLEGVVKKEILEDALNRLKKVKTDTLIMADKELEELLLKQKFYPYPLVRYTERADIVAVHLYQGMFAIFVDTSPCVMLAPCTVFDHFQHTEEYRQTPMSGSYLRILRFLGIFVALFLSPMYLLVNKYNYDIGLLSFLIPKEEQMINIFIQIILAEIGVEFLRMASIHTPSALSTAMGLIAGVVLGEMAVKVGFFSYQTVLVVALSAIGTYATPSYELGLANKISKLFFVLGVYIFGIYGFLIAFFIWLVLLANLKSFNKPYLYPLIPFNIKKLYKVLIRFPYRNKK